MAGKKGNEILGKCWCLEGNLKLEGKLCLFVRKNKKALTNCGKMGQLPGKFKNFTALFTMTTQKSFSGCIHCCLVFCVWTDSHGLSALKVLEKKKKKKKKRQKYRVMLYRWGDWRCQCPVVCTRIKAIFIVLCLAVYMHIMVCSGPGLLKLPHFIHISSKKPLDNAVVHSSKSKDQSLAFVDRHWCHPLLFLKKKKKKNLVQVIFPLFHLSKWL